MRIVLQGAAQRFFRCDMQDVLASQPVESAFGRPQPQQPVPLTAAALRAACVLARRMADADHDTIVVADGAEPGQSAAGELMPVAKPGTDQPPRDRPAGCWHGYHPALQRHCRMLLILQSK